MEPRSPHQPQDDDIITNYITLLKSISMRLDANTVQFFFNDRAASKHRFPLFSQAAGPSAILAFFFFLPKSTSLYCPLVSL